MKSACCGLTVFTKLYWSLSEARLFKQLASRLVHISPAWLDVYCHWKCSQHLLLQHGSRALISLVSLVLVRPQGLVLAGWVRTEVRCLSNWGHYWVQVCMSRACVLALNKWVFQDALHKNREVSWLLGTGGQLSAVLCILPCIQLRTIWRIKSIRKWLNGIPMRKTTVCVSLYYTSEQPQSDRCSLFHHCMYVYPNWLLKQPRLLSSENVIVAWW